MKTKKTKKNYTLSGQKIALRGFGTQHAYWHRTFKNATRQGGFCRVNEISDTGVSLDIFFPVAERKYLGDGPMWDLHPISRAICHASIGMTIRQ